MALFFQGQTGVAELAAAEQQRIAELCFALFWSSLALETLTAPQRAELVQLFVCPRPDGGLHRLNNIDQESLRLVLRSYRPRGNAYLEIAGGPIPLQEVVTNTTLALGNEVVQLGARLCSRYEAPSFVEGPHRAWMAELIKAGCRAKLLSPDVGWEGIVELLQEADREPVVILSNAPSPSTSMEICQTFRTWRSSLPNDVRGEWDRLPEHVRWSAFTTAVRRASRQRRGFEINPHTLGEPSNSGLTAFDLRGRVSRVTDLTGGRPV